MIALLLVGLALAQEVPATLAVPSGATVGVPGEVPVLVTPAWCPGAQEPERGCAYLVARPTVERAYAAMAALPEEERLRVEAEAEVSDLRHELAVVDRRLRRARLQRNALGVVLAGAVVGVIVADRLR